MKEVEAAKFEQAVAPIKGLTVALATAPLTHILPSGLGQAGRFSSTYIFSGAHFQVEPLTGKSVSPTISVKAGLLYLAPAPVGIVPPELYQISPSWIRNIVGVDFKGQESIGAKGSEARVRVFQSEEAERRIIGLVLKDYTWPGTPHNLAFINTADLVQIRYFLLATTTTQARTPAALAAVEAELAKRPVAAGPVVNPLNPVPVPNPLGVGPDKLVNPYGVAPQVTFPTNKIRPIASRAVASAKNGQILNGELVTELADP